VVILRACLLQDPVGPGWVGFQVDEHRLIFVLWVDGSKRPAGGVLRAQ